MNYAVGECKDCAENEISTDGVCFACPEGWEPNLSKIKCVLVEKANERTIAGEPGGDIGLAGLPKEAFYGLTIGTIVVLILMMIVICIVCKRRRKIKRENKLEEAMEKAKKEKPAGKVV